ncbi:hypothetical protein ODJ79_34540 [Actinoplanes sp. KI2]|uniref:hypothetical protein n=1 Tax=Actinoplanes sp. KI2 TaxID=2983315 RepID=UPI0021D5E6FB|nr:hypothetical protein [Actinoplanes sp. KI2]MCU7728859.1 hypothetical protein [Actinoplanes sp. KI2]
MRIPLIPQWNRRPRMPRPLRQAMAELEQLAREPVEYTIDLTSITDGLRTRIGGHAPDLDDVRFRQAVDDYIRHSIDELKAGLHARHDGYMDRLDRLEVMVRPYLDRARTMAHNTRSNLSHMDAAVTNALDQLSDPETPIYDPRETDPPREPRP